MMLHVPATQPAGTKNPVAYELGQIFQLDRDHCLPVASMDEQGGPDLCVGNDAFVFSKLSDIRPDAAMVINRGEPNYNWPGLDKAVYLAKNPVTGFFVPLGTRLADGSNHPGAGTGILISSCLAFDANRTDPIGSGKSGPSGMKWLAVNEVIQLRWDGRKLALTSAEKQPHAAGQAVNDKPFSQLVPQDKGFIGPFGLHGGGLAVVRYDRNGAA